MRIFKPRNTKVVDQEKDDKDAAEDLATQKGYRLRWLRDREYGRPHIAAIDRSGYVAAMASHYGGIYKFLKTAPPADVTDDTADDIA